MGKFVLVVLVFAVAVYAVMSLLERRRVGLPLLPKAGRKPPEPKQVAPDDDEEFLRWLERRRRHDTDPNE